MQTIEVGPTSEKDLVLSQWRQGATLFFEELHLDLRWIDELIRDDIFERVRFGRCEFIGPIDFRDATFRDEKVLLNSCVFRGSVSFANCQFPGDGIVNLMYNTYDATLDLSGADFGNRNVTIKTKEARGACDFGRTSFGKKCSITGDYWGDISLANARLATESMAITAVTFHQAVDLTGMHLPAASGLRLQGYNNASAFVQPDQLIAERLDLLGNVTIAGDQPPAVLNLHTAPVSGMPVPLKSALTVCFVEGSLAGACYTLDSGTGLFNILRRIDSDLKLEIRRNDVDFELTAELVNGRLHVRRPTDPTSKQVNLKLSTDGARFNNMILSMQL